MNATPPAVNRQAPEPVKGAPLRVLVVEDTESDALLTLRALRASGYEPAFERVDSAEAMRSALARQDWDLVLSDYVMPGFGGLEALRIARQSRLDLPFILVSSKVSEEVLVEAMRAGAMDFVMKDRLDRLGPVVKRELADAAARAGADRARIEWRVVLDSVQDAIFVHDADFRIVRANLKYAALAQMPVQALIGKLYWEAFPRAGGPMPGCANVCGGKAGQTEEEVRLPTGEMFSSRSFPIASAAGEGHHYLHVMRDVTERNRVREAIEQSEKRYRALMEHASDLVIVLEAQGIVTYCSPAVRDMGGYEADEVLGRNFIDYVHPGDRSAAIAALHAAVAAPATAHRTEFRLRSKDGSWRVLESVARNALADPLINGIVVNARNVTERIHAAELLRDAEARYHGIFAEARDGIVLIDAESGCATDCNPEFESQSGRTLAQLRGTPIWALRAPAMQAEARAKFEEIKAAGNGSSSELPFVRPDGTQVHVEIVSTVVRMGERTYVQSISRDVTERRLAEEQREQRRERMHAQLEAVGRASMSEALKSGEVEEFARELTELAAEATGVERANVWLFNDDESELRCVDLYEATPARHSAGLVLAEREYAPEFQALKDANYVDADDALRDPRVAGYVEGYVKPLGITSMLDTAIHVTGKHLGVLCLEHVGKPHHWESDEIAFAGRLAGHFALAIVNQSRLRAQGALQKVNRALRVLSAGNMAMVRAENEKSLLAAVCRSVVDVGGYRIAWVGYAIQDDACTVEPQVAAGVSLEKLCVRPLTWEDREGGRGPCGRAIRSGHVQVVQDVQLDEGLAPWLDLARAHGIASYMSLPLHIDGEILGALNIHGSEANAFDGEEVKLLTEMAGDLAYGIRSLRVRRERDLAVVSDQRNLERLGAALKGTIEAVAQTVEKRDPYTAGHQRRVADLAVAIARELGLPADRIEGLRMGATIHDIGKIYVPAEILARPGRLTPAEMEIIKTHTTVGFEIIKGIDFPWPIGQIILQHHERLDGSGYPQGLKGDEVILEARIVGVADVVEAMSSHRPYRPGLGIEAALAQVQKEAGAKLDADAVAACVRLFREKGFQLPA